ncbi:hypothetical protein ACFE04_020228 [Oxalis oulophora]
MPASRSQSRKIPFKLICIIFVFLLIFGLVTLIVWLSSQPHRPRFYVQKLLIPTNSNSRITFEVIATNRNKHVGILYKYIEASVRYKDHVIGFARTHNSSFYQKPEERDILEGFMNSSNGSGELWNVKYRSGKGTVSVVLKFKSSIKYYRSSSWKSGSHKFHANCHVKVGAWDGLMLPGYKGKKCRVNMYLYA